MCLFKILKYVSGLIFIFIVLVVLFIIIICEIVGTSPDLSEITKDYEQYKEVFARVAEKELFSKPEYTRITKEDYDTSNEDLVLLFEQLGYIEIYDFSDNTAYFNKYNSIWDFAGLVYSRVSDMGSSDKAPYYCKFLDDNKQWEYQNTILRPKSNN